MDSTNKNPATPDFISDAALPPNLDFLQLKQAALSYIQQVNGHVWSNFNETDPGVTILEQVCYAISELAYCNDFPIADILTAEDGKIALHNQFFEAAAILTTNPLTLRDFQNLIFDRYSAVRAIYLQAETLAPSATDQFTGRYQVALVLDQSKTEAGQTVQHLSAAIHQCLNQHRNLAEYFLAPTLLQPRVVNLSATVHLQAGKNAATVLAEIQQTLRDYVLPRPVQFGFQQLSASDLSTEAILNGPRMQHGWMAAGELLTPTVLLRIADISLQISQVSGVAALLGLQFQDFPGQPVLAVASNEYAELILGADFVLMENGLRLTHEQGPYQSQLQLAALKSQHAIRGVEAQHDLTPALPQGRFRDIASYYSIQNTFPDSYGVGPNSLEQAAPAYRIAAARQLKAYLLVYDQILANQFAQTAHLADLFAFTPRQAQVKTPATEPEARRFAQTYYWQCLYQIPDVQNLLRGHEHYAYSFEQKQTPSSREKQAWKRFTSSAYNEYVYGLQQACESEQTAEQRREAFLNHLLARQGYFMGDYDVLLQAPVRYGTPRRSRIIAKTIWLQNEQLLSYARYTGFDPLAARKLSDLASYDKQQNLAAQQRNATTTGSAVKSSSETAATSTINGVPDLPRIWAQHKIRQQDLADCSSFECRLDQLLGLREYLQQLIHSLERVLADPSFMSWLLRDAATTSLYLPEAELVLQAGEQHDLLAWRQGDQSEAILQINWSAAGKASLADYHQILLQLRWLSEQRRACLLIEPILLLDPAQPVTLENYGYCLTVFLILPDYVMRFRSLAFQRDLQQLQQQFFPLHLTLQIKLYSPVLLRALIHSYTLWHNQAQSATLRNKYARQLRRLLQLPDADGAPHVE